MSTDLMETMLRQRDAEIAALRAETERLREERDTAMTDRHDEMQDMRAENDRLRAEVAALRGCLSTIRMDRGYMAISGMGPTIDALLTGERRGDV